MLKYLSNAVWLRIRPRGSGEIVDSRVRDRVASMNGVLRANLDRYFQYSMQARCKLAVHPGPDIDQSIRRRWASTQTPRLIRRLSQKQESSEIDPRMNALPPDLM